MPKRPLAGSIRTLSRIRLETPSVLSCYVSLSAADRARQAYLAEVKREIRRLERGLAAANQDHETREAVRRDTSAMLRWLGQTDHLPGTRGLALFVNGQSKLFEAIPMTRVIKTRIALDTTPQLAELIADQDAGAHYLAVVVDRARGRLFEVSGTDAVELVDLVDPGARGGKYRGDRRGAPGWGERDYHHRIEEERHRHFAAIASEVERRMRNGRLHGLVLAGPAEQVEAFRHFLPDEVSAQLLGAARLNPKSVTASEVREVTARLERESEEQRHEALLARIESGLGTGWSVMGVRETLGALERGQLRTIMVALEADAAAFRCQPSGRLVLEPGECDGTRAVAAPSLVNEVIEESLRQAIDVVVVRDQGLGERIPGLAGLCRFVTKPAPTR